MSISSNFSPIQPPFSVKEQTLETAVTQLQLSETDKAKREHFKLALSTMITDLTRLPISGKLKYRGEYSNKVVDLFKKIFKHPPSEAQKRELTQLTTSLYEHALSPKISHKDLIHQLQSKLTSETKAIIDDILENALLGFKERANDGGQIVAATHEITKVLGSKFESKEKKDHVQEILTKFFKGLRQKEAEEHQAVKIIPPRSSRSRRISSQSLQPTRKRIQSEAPLPDFPLFHDVDALTKDYEIAEEAKLKLTEALKTLKTLPVVQNSFAENMYKRSREKVLSLLQGAVGVHQNLTNELKTNLRTKLTDIEQSWMFDHQADELLNSLGLSHATSPQKEEIRGVLKDLHQRIEKAGLKHEEIDASLIPLYDLENIQPAKFEIGKILGDPCLQIDHRLSDFLWNLVK